MKKTLWVCLVAAGWLTAGNVWAQIQSRAAGTADQLRDADSSDARSGQDARRSARDAFRGQTQTRREAAPQESAPSVSSAPAAQPVVNPSRERPSGQTLQRGSVSRVENPVAGSVENRGVRTNRQTTTQGGTSVRTRANRTGVNQVRSVNRSTNRAIQANRPSPILAKEEMVRTPRSRSVLAVPRQGPDGSAFTAKAVSWAPRADRMAVLRNPALLRNVEDLTRRETVRGRYYWHRDRGHDFCHYYDDWGFHWYGWTWGGDFHWTRYHANRWWWYDTRFDRWCWWHGGYWWWQDPVRVNVIYVYDDGRYIPSDEQYTELAPEPVSSTAKKMFSNQSGTRLVKVFGAARDAFLYDTNKSPAFQPVFLASGAKDVRFVDDPFGDTRQVVVTLQDNSVALFDAQGNSYMSPDGGY